MSASQPRGPHHRTQPHYRRGEAISSDSCGPVPDVGIGGERYVVTFIDVATKFAAAIQIMSRDEIPDLIDATFNRFIRDYGSAPKCFVSDNAREYVSERVRSTLQQFECKAVPTSTYSPEENGIVERLNRTLLDAICADLHTAEMHSRFWPLELQEAVYKYNIRHHSTKLQPLSTNGSALTAPPSGSLPSGNWVLSINTPPPSRNSTTAGSGFGMCFPSI